MSKEEILKLMEKSMFEGIKFGKALEAEEDKSKQLPVAIKATVQWKTQEILNQNKDE